MRVHSRFGGRRQQKSKGVKAAGEALPGQRPAAREEALKYQDQTRQELKRFQDDWEQPWRGEKGADLLSVDRLLVREGERKEGVQR